MRLPITSLKEKMQNAAGLIAFKLKAISCPTGQRCLNTPIKKCNTQDEPQTHETQTQTFPGRSMTARPEYYTLINSPKLRVIKADYLGQAILKTQYKVVIEPYW